MRDRAQLKSQPLKREMHFCAEHHCFCCKILWRLAYALSIKIRSTFAGVHAYQSLRAIYIAFIAEYSRRIVLLCVAIISDGDEWMNGHYISHSCTLQDKNERGGIIATLTLLSKKLYPGRSRFSVYQVSFVVMVA